MTNDSGGDMSRMAEAYQDQQEQENLSGSDLYECWMMEQEAIAERNSANKTEKGTKNEPGSEFSQLRTTRTN
jgi:hypothetical protein